MNKPEVKIIQNQEEVVNDSNLDNWEVEQLLRKYGYNSEPNTQYTNHVEPNQQNNLTFEELVLQNEAKIREEEKRKLELRKSRSDFYIINSKKTQNSLDSVMNLTLFL